MIHERILLVEDSGGIHLILSAAVTDMPDACPVTLDDILGESTVMQQVFKSMRQAAPHDTPVLLRGEAGTGKKMAARAIHSASRRRTGPFVTIDCTALSDEAAGTGRPTTEIFERARGGTLFLYKIEALPLTLQAAVLEAAASSGAAQPGTTRDAGTGARIICASCTDLETMVKEGCFHKRLYGELCPFAITLPPLRDRDEDAGLLAGHFLEKYCREFGIARNGIEEATREILADHDWPGNVRELEEVVKCAVLMTEHQLGATLL